MPRFYGNRDLSGRVGTLFRSGIAMLLLIAGFACQGADLRILAWPGYVSPLAIKSFEARYKVSVAVDVISTDDDLWTRINHGEGEGYDLLAVNTAELRRYIEAGLVMPIRTGNIPNLRNQAPRFRNLSSIPGITKDGAVYAIPYTYSAMGLIYNKKLVPFPPASLNAMWDPRYRDRVLLYDGSAHNFSLAALTLGIKNPFLLDDLQFAQTVHRLRALRENIRNVYRSPEEAVQTFQNDEIAIMFANYGDQQLRQLQQAGADIGYVIPAEGALAWLDCWAITHRTTNPALAEVWINHLLTPVLAGELTSEQGLANTLRDTSSVTLQNRDKLIWLQPVENADRRSRYWERLMAGKFPARPDSQSK